MEEEKSNSSRVLSSFVAAGDRQRFFVELRPGETTIVSWKKLIKDANKVAGSKPPSEQPIINAQPNLEARIAPPAENEPKDAPQTNRFSAVIEKIERLYMGKESSDEEDLSDVPDDDQYDTEDSFIDDTELDEYFEVDKSTTKHNGFFVNRGKLERVNEPSSSPVQQPKKRRRKDSEKSQVESGDVHVPNKHVKVDKKCMERPGSLLGKNASVSTQSSPVISENEHMKFQNQMNSSTTHSKKKSADTRTVPEPSMSSKVSNDDASAILAEPNIEKQKTGVVQTKNTNNKLKDGIDTSNSSHHKHHDRNSHAQIKSQTAKPLYNANEAGSSTRRAEKEVNRELPDLNLPEGKYSSQTVKTLVSHRKEGSTVRPKGSILEKNIRELEKMVAESRPPSMEVQDADNAAQAIKRRLPREIKLKLAKVARVAHTVHGKIPKELIGRLMSIVGHLMQLRTLKRNLKIMVNTSLTAKQEKDDKFQQIKREVVEMIKTRGPSLKSKANEQQIGSSDDFQEFASEEKGAMKRKCSMDEAMEDKICDLYDLYVDGLDEDSGSQIRKLYAELAELWPSGLMDNHGIKRAICRAKERKRTLFCREQEKIKRKKLLSKTEETVRVEANPVPQPNNMQERLISDSGAHGLPSSNRPISNTASAVARVPSSSSNGPSLDRPKPEKVKGSSINSAEEVRTADGAVIKKKVKLKPETEPSEVHPRPEKSSSQLGEDRQKSHKQTATLSQKLSLQSASIPSSEQLS
ncbi:Hpc2-related domain [Dillenia turbinata]|uniref:Hpc2-related domain n=1 Tax=Dillenia turbinata TaxID=194707 RepID=A0AAN8W1S7_9MAGN